MKAARSGVDSFLLYSVFVNVRIFGGVQLVAFFLFRSVDLLRLFVKTVLVFIMLQALQSGFNIQAQLPVL